MHTIKALFESKRPFFVGRIAGIELQIAYHMVHGHSREVRQGCAELENNAGIYAPTKESLQAYIDRLLRAYDHCTAIAEWESDGAVYAITGKGQQLISRRTPSVPKFPARALEPYYASATDSWSWSWMPCLRGKRVLIVHPFENTIRAQIPKLSDVFPDRQGEWFSECTFHVLRPPVTLAGNHREMEWSEHLSVFLSCLEDVPEVDVALVAAGGYGMLIADELFSRRPTTSVIYVGGALQLFFGIIGKRWFNQPDVMRLVTDEWIRPVAADKPPEAARVEKGCYW